MTPDADIAVIKNQLADIKEDTADIKSCLFGNGSKGLKARVIILEVKWWIVLVLLVPVFIYIFKEIMK